MNEYNVTDSNGQETKREMRGREWERERKREREIVCVCIRVCVCVCVWSVSSPQLTHFRFIHSRRCGANGLPFGLWSRVPENFRLLARCTGTHRRVRAQRGEISKRRSRRRSSRAQRLR